MRSLIFLFVLPLLAPVPLAAKIADVVCDTQERLVARMEAQFGAERQGRGLRGPDTVLEVWVVPKTGDWTLVQSYSNGQSCIVAMGEHWETLRPLRDPA